MTREWIALERHEGRAGDLSLYARALHAQLHRWVDGDGRIPARLDGDMCDLCESMARSIAFRYGARRSDRRLLVGHLLELVDAGAVVLSPDGLELRALADGADLVRHRLAIGDRSSASRTRTATNESRSDVTVSRTVTNEQRTETNEQRTETKADLSARNSEGHSSRVEESTREEKRVGEGEGERSAPALPLHDSIPSTEAPKRARTKRPPTVPPTDTVPLDGTTARRVYEAITTDVALAPIVRGPGDLSTRLAALCDGTSVDPAAEVIAAGAWLLRSPGRWSDGAAGLLRWVRTAADRARAVPAPVVGVPRAATNTRTDYQGRTVAGPAALPSGDVWTTDRDEETEAFERIRQRTQPRGASK